VHPVAQVRAIWLAATVAAVSMTAAGCGSSPGKQVTQLGSTTTTTGGSLRSGASVDLAGIDLADARLCPSKTHDALNVTVTVKLVGANGKVVSDDQGFVWPEIVRVIPAGQTVYVGSDLTAGLFGVVHVKALRISVAVASTPARRYGLPPVSNVHVDATGEVTGTVTNPYSTAMSPYDYTASAVFYDRHGRIVGGSSGGNIGGYRFANIKPGRRAQVSLIVPQDVSRARIASARVSVFPQ
jgi:hypothetical protein